MLIIRKGTFELTRQFTQGTESHLDGRSGWGALNLRASSMVKQGDKFMKVAT